MAQPRRQLNAALQSWITAGGVAAGDLEGVASQRYEKEKWKKQETRRKKTAWAELIFANGVSNKGAAGKAYA